VVALRYKRDGTAAVDVRSLFFFSTVYYTSYDLCYVYLYVNVSCFTSKLFDSEYRLICCSACRTPNKQRRTRDRVSRRIVTNVTTGRRLQIRTVRLGFKHGGGGGGGSSAAARDLRGTFRERRRVTKSSYVACRVRRPSREGRLLRRYTVCVT